MSGTGSQRPSLSAIRAKAWITRRLKYGPHGHGKPCYQTHRTPGAIERAREEISVARRHLQLLLPEEPAHRAITALDRADEALGGPAQWAPSRTPQTARESSRADLGD